MRIYIPEQGWNKIVELEVIDMGLRRKWTSRWHNQFWYQAML